jgi:integrase
VDLPIKIINIPSSVSKNGKQQSVTITAPLAKAIEKMKLQKVNLEWKLFSRDLLPGPVEIFRNRVSERHRRALDAIGITGRDVTLYSWKHTGVVNAFRAGLDIKKLQSHLRHHSLEMTDIYLKSLGLVIDKELENKEW